MTLEELEAVIQQLGEAVAKLPKDSLGRQRDPGADLRYAGYVLLLQYEDPGQPGIVYTANPALWHVQDPTQAHFQARRDLSIQNGIVGPRVNLAGAFLDHFGELRPILGVLGALGVLPPLLVELLGPSLPAGTDPSAPIIGLLQQLLGQRTAVK